MRKSSSDLNVIPHTTSLTGGRSKSGRCDLSAEVKATIRGPVRQGRKTTGYRFPLPSYSSINQCSIRCKSLYTRFDLVFRPFSLLLVAKCTIIAPSPFRQPCSFPKTTEAQLRQADTIVSPFFFAGGPPFDVLTEAQRARVLKCSCVWGHWGWFQEWAVASFHYRRPEW